MRKKFVPFILCTAMVFAGCGSGNPAPTMPSETFQNLDDWLSSVAPSIPDVVITNKDIPYTDLTVYSQTNDYGSIHMLDIYDYCTILVVGRKALVVDAGTDYKKIKHYLKELDLDEINFAFSSTSRSHAGSAAALISDFKDTIKYVFLPPMVSNETVAKIRSAADNTDILFPIMTSGAEVTLCNGITLKTYLGYDATNAIADGNMLIHASVAGHSILALGNMNEREQNTFLKSNTCDLSSEIVIVSAFGNNDTLSSNLFASTKARYCVAPNSNKQISGSVKNIVSKNNARLLCLSDDGGYVFRIEDSMLFFKTEVAIGNEEEDSFFETEAPTEFVDYIVAVTGNTYHTDYGCLALAKEKSFKEVWYSSIMDDTSYTKCEACTK